MSRLDPQSWARPQYPFTPGYRNRETSQAAAEAVQSRAGVLRELVRKTISASAGLTADEVADALGESVLSVRPRVTELAKQFKITDSGLRRPNRSGRNAIVWKV